MNVLIVPDKFKGTLTASEAGESLRRGWEGIRRDDMLQVIPMSDGGDGFGSVMNQLMGGELQRVVTVDAAHRPVESAWWWVEKDKTAIIETAQVIGLALLPAGKYHPFELDTYGLGALLQAAKAKGSKRFLVGIGGSATNDAGFGLARALGWQFFNSHSEKISRWTDLHDLVQLRPADDLAFNEMVVAVDVGNPLLGLKGCTRIYGPQKGLREEDFDFAERCLGRLSSILNKELHLNFTDTPGAGAAGGLGYGLHCFCGAKLQNGFGLFSSHAGLAEKIKGVDLVITGEGSIDDSTFMGKGVGEVARMCREAGVPCIGVAGLVRNPSVAAEIFTKTFSMAPDLTDAGNATKEPSKWMQILGAEVAKYVSGARDRI